jgi:hypothetical protein
MLAGFGFGIFSCRVFHWFCPACETSELFKNIAFISV